MQCILFPRKRRTSAALTCLFCIIKAPQQPPGHAAWPSCGRCCACAGGGRMKDAVRRVAEDTGLPRNDLYNAALAEME